CSSSASSTTTAAGSQPCQLRVDEPERTLEPEPVRRSVEPAARAGRVRQRDDHPAVLLVALADARRQLERSEEVARRQTADGHGSRSWPSTIPGAWPNMYARCPKYGARTGSDSSG